MFVPKRIDVPELLDEHDAPREDVERSLRDLRRFNRFYGGAGVYRRLLRRMAKHDPLSILDVATGTADLLEKSIGTPLRVGVDFKIDHLLYMREGSAVRRVVGDALQIVCDKDQIERRSSRGRAGFQHPEKFPVNRVLEIVHFVIGQ